MIRSATETDCSLILSLIKGLAKFEKLEHEVLATEEMLRSTLFSEQAKAHVLIGECAGELVAFALYFYSYSTFLAKPGLYLEDLFVMPEMRGRGFGQKILSRLASIALEQSCGRFEWSVLDWNKDAVRFYERLGAKPNHGWSVYRLTGDGLQNLAELES